MSDEVLVPYGDDSSETATLLLGAADDKGYEPWVVRHQPDDAGFRVPADVAKAAGLKPVDEDKQAEVEADEARERSEEQQRIAAENQGDNSPAAPDKPAKKTAKKTAAKKTTSK